MWKICEQPTECEASISIMSLLVTGCCISDPWKLDVLRLRAHRVLIAVRILLPFYAEYVEIKIGDLYSKTGFEKPNCNYSHPMTSYLNPTYLASRGCSAEEDSICFSEIRIIKKRYLK
ncbi:hypothetical protein CEXT_784511 [Caerostris extrusa]|uniref:Uncharacterized protein n=1 Tax=Caerostris extrusa TaxID=172846 RepID=A0AAV4R193_CAEEX|nr:hypothetical protein CEXT_784511 [Caerostris extrusa]